MKAARLRLLLWLAILLLLALPFLTPLLRRGHGGPTAKPTELMVEAAVYANETLKALQRILNLQQPPSLDYSTLSRNALIVARLLAENASSLPEEGFSGILRRALESYAQLASSAGKTAEQIPALAEGFSKASEALQALGRCDVEGYLKLYGSARSQLLEALPSLEEAYTTLSTANTDSLLSQAHRETAEKLLETLAITVGLIEEMEKLYSIVKSSPDSIKALCNTTIHTKNLTPLLHSLKQIRAPGSCPLSYQLAYTISKLTRKHQKQPGGGSGAGYAAPTSND